MDAPGPTRDLPARVVFHVDMDAFYASVEVRDDPSLKGKPVIVGADPRGGKGRGVVCTASYEARKYGVRSAMPISQAYRLAPHAVFVPPDFRKYGAASAAVMQVLERYADVRDDGESSPSSPSRDMGAVPEGRCALEQVGLDEAYLDVTGRCTPEGAAQPDWDLARSLALSLQAAVRRETGLSCSIGIAPSKGVAKVATDQRKPHGITRVLPDRVRAFLDPLPVRVLNGCGPKTAQALRDEALATVSDVAALPREAMERLLGSHGAWLWQMAHGNDPRRVVADHGERKSRGNETTFLQDARDRGQVLKAAADLLEESLDRHDRRDRRAWTTLTVKLRYADYATLTRARTVEVPFETRRSDTPARAWATVKALLDPLLDGRAVRLVGVRMSGFMPATGQRPLTAYGVAMPAEESGADPLALPAAVRVLASKPWGAFDPGGGLREARGPVVGRRFAGAPETHLRRSRPS